MEDIIMKEEEVEQPKENFKDKMAKKIFGSHPKDAMFRLMKNNEFDVLEYDEEGNLCRDETGKPVISTRKMEIRSMYDMQTNNKFKDAKQRKHYYKTNKKQLMKSLEKQGKTEEEIDSEITRLKSLYSKGYYPEFKGQNIHQLYMDEVKVKDPQEVTTNEGEEEVEDGKSC